MPDGTDCGRAAAAANAATAGGAVLSSSHDDDHNVINYHNECIGIVQENNVLKQDLQYITECVTKHPSKNDDNDDDGISSSTFYAGIMSLLQQRIQHPDHPYLDISSSSSLV